MIDDEHNEEKETLTLTLSNASSGRLTDAAATGTIKNRDPLPRALLARFGRTAAVHVVEQVEERIQAPREPGVDGRFAGFTLRPGMGSTAPPGQLARSVRWPGRGQRDTHRAGRSPVRSAAWRSGIARDARARGRTRHGHSRADGRHVRAGQRDGDRRRPAADGLRGRRSADRLAFSLNRETRQGGILSFWSRGARSYFSGREGALSLGGDVRTTMFGADYAKGPLMAGLSLSHSQGLGEYAGAAGGQAGHRGDRPLPLAGLQGHRPRHRLGCGRVRRRRDVVDARRRAGAGERPVDGDGGGRDAGRARGWGFGRFRACVQGRCPAGRYVDRRRRWPGGTPEGDRSGGDPLPDGT